MDHPPSKDVRLKSTRTRNYFFFFNLFPFSKCHIGIYHAVFPSFAALFSLWNRNRSRVYLKGQCWNIYRGILLLVQLNPISVRFLWFRVKTMLQIKGYSRQVTIWYPPDKKRVNFRNSISIGIQARSQLQVRQTSNRSCNSTKCCNCKMLFK